MNGSDAVGGQTSAKPDLITVPVIEEQVSVAVRTVERGGWRISKHVSVHDETVDQPLLRQQVEIERRAIGQLLPTMEAPPVRHEGATMVIAVVEEVLVTHKRLLLKEEIRITRVDSTVHDPQQVSLRREEVSIEPLEADHKRGADPP